MHEQIDFLKKQQWTITNYLLLVYAAWTGTLPPAIDPWPQYPPHQAAFDRIQAQSTRDAVRHIRSATIRVSVITQIVFSLQHSSLGRG
jgi:hypothetical protein